MENRDAGSIEFSDMKRLNVINKYFTFLAVLCLISVSNDCQKPKPVDLNLPLSDVVIHSTAAYSSLLSTDDIDSSKLFSPLEVKGMGQLLIEGAEYDSRVEHHTASIARALFYDGSSPLVIGSDTVYPALNVGTIKIDNLTLGITSKHFLDSAGTTDTVLGVQYLLFNKDGVGGNGFTYVGNQEYHWNCPGNGRITAFDQAVTAPPSIHVVYPNERTTVRSSSDLLMHWTGGADTVRIYVRELNNGIPGKSWLNVIVKNKSGSVNIPKSLLQLLPHDQTEFMFTVTSSRNTIVNLDGFAGDVVVQAVTSHNLVLQVKP